MDSVNIAFRKMTREDWAYAGTKDHRTAIIEIDNALDGWLMMIQSGKANAKQKAIIDAAILVMYSAMEDGKIMVKKAGRWKE